MKRWIDSYAAARVRLTGLVYGALALACGTVFAASAASALPAAVVLDARSGNVLVADNADTRQPAPALPKLMTIYLMFEAFESGTVRPGTNIFVSAAAAKQPQPSLGLREFDTLEAGLALDAVLAASANDAAAVLADFLAGSQPRFIEMMNAKAKQLGLTNTHFTNITGAPDPQQYSTPRDMIRFSLALMSKFPERAKRLVGVNFAWQGKTYQGPKNFLGALATGVNRARSARAKGRDVIAVVWNAADEAKAETLLQASLARAETGPILNDAAPPAVSAAGAPVAAGSWGLQLGAFSSEAAARSRLAAALNGAPELKSASATVEPLQRAGGTLYRAKYVGMDEASVRRICAGMKAAGNACLPVAP